MCLRKHFIRKMWPIQLPLLRFIVCTVSLSSLTHFSYRCFFTASVRNLWYLHSELPVYSPVLLLAAYLSCTCTPVACTVLVVYFVCAHTSFWLPDVKWALFRVARRTCLFLLYCAYVSCCYETFRSASRFSLPCGLRFPSPQSLFALRCFVSCQLRFESQLVDVVAYVGIVWTKHYSIRQLIPTGKHRH